ncbi:hypothetical protein SAY87_006353 [Trapa incisa]|uniref:Disease resistance N-terminal domain-containing protein n=1 Tax=Trapa incisa TaxID=236973 RepID=A0AAN7PYL4_9MYRT|nr:hypothetical protein SAY87_006353 [Trapa incisa]
MGELILGSVVDSITGQLVSLISQEIGGALGAKGELEKLRNTVDAIRAVFAEAEKRQVEEEPIKLWLKKLGNAFYVADDLLDDFATEILRRRRLVGGGVKCNDRMMKEVRIFFSSSNRLLFNLKMAHRVKAIRGTLDAIDSDKYKYSFKHDSTVNPALRGGGEGGVIWIDLVDNGCPVVRAILLIFVKSSALWIICDFIWCLSVRPTFARSVGFRL